MTSTLANFLINLVLISPVIALFVAWLLIYRGLGYVRDFCVWLAN